MASALLPPVRVLGDLADSVDDSLVAGAAAEVAAEALADLVVGGARVVAEHRRHADDEAGCAEPALQAMAIAERLLHRRQAAAVGPEAFDRGDFVSVGLHREHEAGPHGVTVEQHG